MHNLVGQIQTRDTFLGQCKNMRRIFDEYVANYMISFPTSTTKEAYEAVISPKSRLASDLSPAEKMLRAANFTYMKKPNSTEYMGTMYPHVRAFCLKDKKTWEQFERLMTAYQKAEIPHPFMAHAILEMNHLFQEPKRGGNYIKNKVAKIIKDNR